MEEGEALVGGAAVSEGATDEATTTTTTPKPPKVKVKLNDDLLGIERDRKLEAAEAGWRRKDDEEQPHEEEEEEVAMQMLRVFVLRGFAVCFAMLLVFFLWELVTRRRRSPLA